MQARRHVWGGVVLLAAILVAGCHKNENPVSTVSSTDPATTAAMNAAASTNVASGLSVNDFGAADQMGDMVHLTHLLAVPGPAVGILGRDDGMEVDSVVRSYDSTTGWWTVTMFRERSREDHFVEFERTYQLQFLTAGGGFLKFWRVGSDTATSLHFKIVSGQGVRSGDRGIRRLISLSGDWMVDGLKTDTLHINTADGVAYTRVQADTMTHDDAFRTSYSTLSLTFTDVTGPRDEHLGLAEATGGTISGSYHAVVTFQRDSVTVSTTIDQTINITLGSDSAHFGFGGKLFVSDLRSGDCREEGGRGD